MDLIFVIFMVLTFTDEGLLLLVRIVSRLEKLMGLLVKIKGHWRRLKED